MAINPYDEPAEASNSAHGNLSSALSTVPVFAGAGASFGRASAVVHPDFKISGFAEVIAAGSSDIAGANGSVSIHAKLADFVQAGDGGSQNILLSPVEISTGGEGSRSAEYRFEFFETNSHKVIAQGSFHDGSQGFGVTGDFVKEDFKIGPHQQILLSNLMMPIDVSQITPGADLTLTHQWTVSGNNYFGGDGLASVTIVPEPSAWILFGIGLLAVHYRSRPQLQHIYKNNLNPSFPVAPA